jgi:hypothetical protein
MARMNPAIHAIAMAAQIVAITQANNSLPIAGCSCCSVSPVVSFGMYD